MTNSDQETKAALMLAALGSETRLRTFRTLVRAGPGGLGVGAIQARLAIPASTLQHHLGALVHAGLVVQQRHGRAVLSAVDYDAISGLVDYLTHECCADQADTHQTRPPRACNDQAARRGERS